MIKSFLKSYFGFSKKELNGLLIFCFLILLIAFAPSIYQYFSPVQVFSYKKYQQEIDQFLASAKQQRSYSYKQLKDQTEDRELEASYFDFDPNGLSESLWKKLGLSNRQIKTIKNYESKGGHFYHKEDVGKMYSIPAEQYAKLEPYIKIPERQYANSKYEKFAFKKYEKPVKAVVNVDLNSADSSQLETVNGIGASFALRIIKYRDRLGGFYTKEQLKEVFGIDSAKYEQLQSQIHVDETAVRKININTAIFDDLKANPYLTYKQMNAIVQYRKQHGNYTSVNDLKKIVILNTETIKKLEPYLIF